VDGAARLFTELGEDGVAFLVSLEDPSPQRGHDDG
jgi:hypothetical protein